jgi:DNA-binding transcriptional MocR family regulator
LVFGSLALREQLAKRLGRAGVSVSPDDVVLTHGDGESLQLCLGLLTQPGDRVAVASPGSLRVLEVVAALGLQAIELPVLPEGDGLVTGMTALLAREKLAACVIDVSLFSAAAGGMSDADKQSLVRLLATHQVPLIEFDLMGELHRGVERARPLKAFDPEDGVIYCSSLACITGPGFSVGFVASGRHRLQLRAARSVHGDLIPQLTDHVLAEFLSGTGFDAHLRRLRLRLRRQVAAWTQAVQQYFPKGTRVSTSDAGYVLWVELPGGLAASDLLRQARAGGWTFVPGAVFGSTERFDHCLRLAAAHPLDEVRMAGLKLLGEAACQALDPARPVC